MSQKSASSTPRVTFFPGQRLAAADLTALQRSMRLRRWLHNRALHGWGIAQGLVPSGQRGDTTVSVSPGLGIDAFGREALLAQTRTLAVPAVASDPGGAEAVFYIVAAYQDDSKQAVLEERDGICHEGGAVRLADEPLLDWRRPDQLEEGRELVLAKAWVKGCRLSRALSLKVRRYVRAPRPPYLTAGQTTPGSTEWTAWIVSGSMAGVKTEVDTSSARFQATPRYMARLGGHRFWSASPGPLLAVVVITVEDAKPDGFTCAVQIPDVPGNLTNPGSLRNPGSTPGLVKNTLDWHVVWSGIEDAP
jgi:hypothetical protein